MVDDYTGSDVSDEVSAAPETATITSRIETLTDEGIVGLTVAEAREQFAQVLNISPNANASTGSGRDRVFVDEDYVIQAGDKVNFALALGEKGI